MPIRPNPPILTLSSTACRWMGLTDIDHVAQMSGARGVDLDLRPGLVRALSRDHRNHTAHTPITSIWLSRSPFGTGLFRHTAVSGADLAEVIVAQHAPRLVVDRRQLGDKTLGSLMRSVQDLSDGTIRLTLSLSSDQLEGSRDHLAALSALRRTAEEWDYDLALDLTGPIDPRWEAEAALNRVLPRLRIIRVSSLTSRPPDNARARLTNRTISFALDQGYQDVISISPYVPLWRAFWTTPIASAFIEDAHAIRAKYELIHHIALPPAPSRQTPRAKHRTI
jgi:hypothetical protein